MSEGSIPHPGLIPTGTARALFLGAIPSGADAGLPPDLRALLSARDVRDEDLWAAWEVTTWATGAPTVDRRALACLVVTLLEAISAGGTFLPLDVAATHAHTGPTKDADSLVDRLRHLGLGAGDRMATRALAAALVSGTATPAIAALVGPPGSRRPFILSDGALYPERYWYLEDRLVTLLRARMTGPLSPLPAAVPVPMPPHASLSSPAPSSLPTLGSVDEAVAALNAGKGAAPLGSQQLAAVRAALTQPLTIIAGGPGTGKTSTVVGVMRALARLGIPADDVALAAPTGRAARRMTEAVNVALAGLEIPAPADAGLISCFVGATTLHRLLGIRPGRLRTLEPEAPEYYADWPLPHSFVIVDEASMIDLGLMDRLVAALGPSARLLLIGDVDQLPSVQVGAVFHDLVAGAPAITHRLTHSHRMNPLDPAGAEILRVANSVNAGEVSTLQSPGHTHAGTLTFAGFEQLATSGLDAFLERWHREILAADTHIVLALDRRFALGEGNLITPAAARAVVGTRDADAAANENASAVRMLVDAQLSARILCVTREAGRATSAAALNRVMHARAQTTATMHAPGQSWETAAFIPGEPVIVLRNDRARGLSNGDLGVILRVGTARGEGLGVAFPRADGYVVHLLDAIRGQVDLAFALTVHKAQGSEYDRVALVLPEIDVPLLTREVVYTALTRARHSVVVVGDPSFFNLAASRPLARTSGIAAKLAARGPA